ncbi:MAG: CarD family transcriptional regulator [Gemmatimonadota bacterium]|nr:CarD family transcriptional regulator [Gemmatimonadota bacterium]
MSNDEFKIDDKVVHPQYGGGRVAGIEDIEVGGETLECLEIQCVSKGRKIFVPKGSVELSAIRPPLDEEEYEELKSVLTGEPEEMNRNFNRRMKVVKTKLESGDPLKVAEILRDMYPKWSENSLSSSDQRMFEKSRDLLVSEIALIEDLSYEDTVELIEQTMANGAAAREAAAAEES